MQTVDCNQKFTVLTSHCKQSLKECIFRNRQIKIVVILSLTNKNIYTEEAERKKILSLERVTSYYGDVNSGSLKSYHKVRTKGDLFFLCLLLAIYRNIYE